MVKLQQGPSTSYVQEAVVSAKQLCCAVDRASFPSAVQKFERHVPLLHKQR